MPDSDHDPAGKYTWEIINLSCTLKKSINDQFIYELYYLSLIKLQIERKKQFLLT